MKKYVLFGLIIGLLPNMCMGNARVTQLMQEKQRKMAELEKCMGSTKGLKIAGISTLGLTAVGVAGNIVEAKKIDEYKDKAEKTDKKIESVQKDINKKTEEIQNLKNTAESTTSAKPDDLELYALKDLVEEDANAISNSTVFLGQRIYTHGYGYKDLPQSLKSKLAEPLDDFKDECINIVGGGETESVDMRGDDYTINATLTEDNTLSDKEAHVLAVCECNASEGYVQKDEKCVKGNGGGADASTATCGVVGKKDCHSNYFVCNSDSDCTSDKLPDHATEGHCWNKKCTATKCESKYEPYQGYCKKTNGSSAVSTKPTAAVAETVDLTLRGREGYALSSDGKKCAVAEGGRQDFATNRNVSECTNAGVSASGWKIVFLYGSVTGTSKCSGNTCSCQATAGDFVKAHKWVTSTINASDCTDCAYWCAMYAYNENQKDYRKELFGL